MDLGVRMCGADEMLSVGDRFFSQPSDVVVPGGVVDAIAVSASRDHTGEAKLHQMLGHRRWLSLDVGGQLVHGVLTMHEGPHDAQPRGVSQQFEHGGRFLDLVDRRLSNYLLKHAGRLPAALQATSIRARMPSERMPSSEGVSWTLLR